MSEITLLQALEGFFESNEHTYYMITDRNGYNTVLRVDDLDEKAANTEDFILHNIGDIEFGYRDGETRFDFTSNDKQYYLFGYDGGIVSI
nr:hypothetical protein [Paenibacillus xylanexedens]